MGDFWHRSQSRKKTDEPLPNQCRYIHPSGVRCGQPISHKHGADEFCYSHRAKLPDGRRGTGRVHHNTHASKKDPMSTYEYKAVLRFCDENITSRREHLAKMREWTGEEPR